MDEGFVCECGASSFWFFWDRVRCPVCFNEYQRSEHYNGHLEPREELWMRRFNNEVKSYDTNWEKAPRSFKNHINYSSHERED